MRMRCDGPGLAKAAEVVARLVLVHVEGGIRGFMHCWQYCWQRCWQ